MENDKKLFLLDAYALIYRAYYAFIKNPMYNADGLNTSCIFGFVNTLEDLLSKEKPTHIAVAFDPGGKNFRHEMFSDYKANRQETPEDIKKSLPYIKEILIAYGIPVLLKEGFEADDIIGTLSVHAASRGYQVYMMTPDKDYIQLLSDKVFMYKPNRSGGIDVVDKQAACANFHLQSPSQFIDILALMGDTSDNIPGAPGVGEKTAIKLVEEYGSIEGVFSNVDKLKGKLKDIISNHKADIEMSKVLATIRIDVAIEVTEEELILSKPDIPALQKLFSFFNFKTFERRVLNRLNPPVQAPVALQGTLFDIPVEVTPTVSHLKTIHDVQHNYHLVDSLEKCKDLAKQLNALSEFCFDTETTSLDVFQAQLVGMSFSWIQGEAWYVPFPENQNEAKVIVSIFKPVFENSNIQKVAQNIKFDAAILKNYDIHIVGKIFDTMLAHYLIQPEGRHNMDVLSEKYLSYKPVSIEELIGLKGKNQLNMRQVSIDKIKEYAAEDADVTWQLSRIFNKELNSLGLMNLAESIEMPLALVLMDMECAGVSLNVSALNEYAGVLRNDIIELGNQIYNHAGIEFNISSPKQLGEILFDRLKIDTDAKKTKTKQYSTNEEVLAQLTDKHPIVPLILEYRGLRKLLNTYVESLPAMINSRSGKIHTSFNQALTATGRLSSADPNLQNIPIRDERGREIRKAFIASGEDYIILSADYSQIELRVMAHASKDANMLSAFTNNEDIHTSTASKIFGVPPAEVTRDMRRKAKTANFGIIYGISAFGLSQRLTIPRKEASELIDGYFRSFPEVKTYMDKCIADARVRGYVETIMRRRRYIPDIQSNNSIIRGVAERNAINSPIQGSAADIIKLAMVNIHSAIKNRNLRSKMILQVHDELVFDVYKPELDEIMTLVKYEMENAVKLDVPLLVEMGYGQNWLEAH
jgi:DNA polymerase-1